MHAAGPRGRERADAGAAIKRPLTRTLYVSHAYQIVNDPRYTFVFRSSAPRSRLPTRSNASSVFGFTIM